MNTLTDHITNPEIGFYTVDQVVFRSKNEAAVYAQSKNSELIWHFSDEVFEKNDWTVEPEESLDFLYNIRAKELREMYDYIVVLYSGGADSTNVVESFLRQNLKVDEILVSVNSTANKLIVNDRSVQDSWNYGAEFSLQIYPRLEEYRLRSPTTKITVVETTDLLMDLLKQGSDGEWVLNCPDPLNPSATRFNYLYFSEIRKRFDKNLKIGVITGVDKPRCHVKDEKFYMVFNDYTANQISISKHFEPNDNTAIEYFYWHPSSVKMITKQCHVLRRWLEFNPQWQKFWRPRSVAEYFTNARLQQPIMRTPLYSTWNHNWYQATKNKDWWYTDLDTWWHELYSDTKEYKIWKAGLDYITKNASKYIVEKNGRPDGLTPCIKKYCIGDAPNMSNHDR